MICGCLNFNSPSGRFERLRKSQTITFVFPHNRRYWIQNRSDPHPSHSSAVDLANQTQSLVRLMMLSTGQERFQLNYITFGHNSSHHCSLEQTSITILTFSSLTQAKIGLKDLSQSLLTLLRDQSLYNLCLQQSDHIAVHYALVH